MTTTHSDWVSVYRGLKVGDRVQVHQDHTAPDWAIGGGIIVSLPSPRSMHYKHPRVEWDSDGMRRRIHIDSLVKVLGR